MDSTARNGRAVGRGPGGGAPAGLPPPRPETLRVRSGYSREARLWACPRRAPCPCGTSRVLPAASPRWSRLAIVRPTAGCDRATLQPRPSSRQRCTPPWLPLPHPPLPLSQPAVAPLILPSRDPFHCRRAHHYGMPLCAAGPPAPLLHIPSYCCSPSLAPLRLIVAAVLSPSARSSWCLIPHSTCVEVVTIVNDPNPKAR